MYKDTKAIAKQFFLKNDLMNDDFPQNIFATCIWCVATYMIRMYVCMYVCTYIAQYEIMYVAMCTCCESVMLESADASQHQQFDKHCVCHA